MTSDALRPGLAVDESGAAYLVLSNKPVARTVEVAPMILVDYAADGSLVGIEVLAYNP